MSRPAERVGPWRLLRELGAGGMGVVWLSERADGAYEGRAAVKLLRAELATPSLRRALEREREMLARLEHPGIARLLDGGAAADGRPYLAMEFVDGRPIDRFCEEEQLSVRARAALVLDVCEAVHHAHRALVVHRDLKPANVLVEPDGRPRLLDFGIAGFVDAASIEESGGAPTSALNVAGTLAYASPEQLAGERVGVASDVYSLGGILYQLLTGRLPHDLDTAGELEALRIVSERRPRRPSDVAPRGPSSRELRGDLDRVLLRALEQDPERRYASVDRLAADLRAFLEHRPVSAQPDTVRYRAGKFLRRNRISVSAFSLGAGALLATFASSSVQFVRAERARTAESEQRVAAVLRLEETLRLGEELEEQRSVAERRFVDARRFATNLIFDLRRRIDATSRVTEASELVLASGLDFLDHLAQEAPDDVAVLEELARGYMRHADLQDSPSQRSLGDSEAADQSLARAQALVARIVELESESVVGKALTADVLHRRAVRAHSAGRVENALELLAKAAEVCEDHPEVEFELLKARARLRLALGGLQSEQGRTFEALEHYEAADAAYEEMLAQRPGIELFVRGDRAFVQAHLCRLWVVAQDPARAVEEGEPAMVVLDELVSAHRNDQRLQRAYVTALACLAEAYLDLDRLDEADALLRRHREYAEAMAAGDPEDSFVLELLHGNHWRRALYHERLDQFEEAVREGRACLAVGERIRALDPDDPTVLLSQSIVLHRLGNQEWTLGHLDEAERALAAGLEHLEVLLAIDPENPAVLRSAYRTHRNLARVEKERGRADRAREEYATSLDQFRRIERQSTLTPADHDNLAEILAGADPR